MDNIKLEGPGRPLNLPRKMLIVTTPAAKAPLSPLERGKLGVESSLPVIPAKLVPAEAGSGNPFFSSALFGA